MLGKIGEEERMEAVTRPTAVSEQDELLYLLSLFLNCVHRGKVWYIYELPGFPDKLLMVALDWISVYGFALSAQIPQRGEILAAMAVMWLTKVFRGMIDHNLCAAGLGIEQYLPPGLKGRRNLRTRSLVVNKSDMAAEFLVSEYQPDDGSRLARPLSMPTVRTGSLDQQSYRKWASGAIDLYHEGSKYAEGRDIVMANAGIKVVGASNQVVSVTAFGCNSSIYWTAKELHDALKQGRPPVDYLRAPLFDWAHNIDGQGMDLRRYNPSNAADVEFVRRLTLPTEVINQISQNQRHIFQFLAGAQLYVYQTRAHDMNCGSK